MMPRIDRDLHVVANDAGVLATCRHRVGVRIRPAMALALKIIGLWVLLSCTLGPCLTWLFFYGKRQRKYARDRRIPAGNPLSRSAHSN